MTKREFFQKYKEFEQLPEAQCTFESIPNKLSSSVDLHAILLLKSLVPEADTRFMLLSSKPAGQYSKVYFTPWLLDVIENITEQQALELFCCGVFPTRGAERFFMYVFKQA